MGTKKNHQKTAKTVYFEENTQPGSKKELVLSIKSVPEDILIYHLRLIEIFSFLKKRFKNLQVLTLGPDPRLLQIGAK